ncbi:MAG: hypothetical protein ABW133_09955, partial [Polyangiaceae bacterium]
MSIIPEEACCILDWHMSSTSIGRLMRHVWDGSFLNTGSMTTAMQRRHGGDVGGNINGVAGEYHAGAIHLDEASNLTVAFVANSPMGSDAMLNRIRDLAITRRNGTTPPTRTKGLDRLRGEWHCALSGSNHVFKLLVDNQYDAKGYNMAEFGGLGSEEVWTATSQSTYPSSSGEWASGTYRWFQAGMSPRFPNSTGTWSLTRTSNGTATLQRVDVGGWTGNYTCNLAV